MVRTKFVSRKTKWGTGGTFQYIIKTTVLKLCKKIHDTGKSDEIVMEDPEGEKGGDGKVITKPKGR